MSKHIVIGGASGLIGSALVAALEQRGDRVTRLVRRSTGENPTGAERVWGPRSGTLDAQVVSDADAVVVLNGVSIAGERWSDERKDLIVRSRTDSVGTAAKALASLGSEAPALIAASAIGIYGDRGDEILTEQSSHGDDFLADVCEQWEAAARPAKDAGVRVVHVRTGIVVSGEGGALDPMLPLFKLGIGGRIGDGSQWWSWVSEADTVGAYLHAIDSEIEGPMNAVSPNPVTNAEFTKALGNALNRPTFLPVPRIGLNIRLGSELAEAIGYASQRVEPAVLAAAGYEFEHPDLDEALAAVLA